MQQTSTEGVQDSVRRLERMIRWKLYEKMIFDHTTKWYMHKQELVKENETFNFRLDF